MFVCLFVCLLACLLACLIVDQFLFIDTYWFSFHEIWPVLLLSSHGEGERENRGEKVWPLRERKYKHWLEHVPSYYIHKKKRHPTRLKSGSTDVFNASLLSGTTVLPSCQIRDLVFPACLFFFPLFPCPLLEWCVRLFLVPQTEHINSV